MPDTDMGVYPIVQKLPVSYSTEIGRIIVRWARVESRLRYLAYDILDVGPKRGRIAVRETNAPAYLAMLKQLMRMRKVSVSTDLKKLQKLLRELSGYRDKLAHGIWVRHPNSKTPVLVETRGDYPPSPGATTISAKEYPRSVAVSLKNLRDIRAGIESADKTLEKMHFEVLAQISPSPNTPHAPDAAQNKPNRARRNP